MKLFYRFLDRLKNDKNEILIESIKIGLNIILEETTSTLSEDTPITKKQIDISSLPAFKKWFGNSKAVDSKGNPVIFYHGTPFDIGHEFKRNIIWVSNDPSLANKYSENISRHKNFSGEGSPNVMKLYVSIQNPANLGFDNIGKLHIEQIISKIISVSGKSVHELSGDVKNIFSQMMKNHGGEEKTIWQYWDEDPLFSKVLSILGFDGIETMENYVKVYGLFKPNQVKSAITLGSFNSDSNSIIENII